jgi:hypothetical protein
MLTLADTLALLEPLKLFSELFSISTNPTKEEKIMSKRGATT